MSSYVLLTEDERNILDGGKSSWIVNNGKVFFTSVPALHYDHIKCPNVYRVKTDGDVTVVGDNLFSCPRYKIGGKVLKYKVNIYVPEEFDGNIRTVKKSIFFGYKTKIHVSGTAIGTCYDCELNLSGYSKVTGHNCNVSVFDKATYTGFGGNVILDDMSNGFINNSRVTCQRASNSYLVECIVDVYDRAIARATKSQVVAHNNSIVSGKNSSVTLRDFSRGNVLASCDIFLHNESYVSKETVNNKSNKIEDKRI